MNDSRLDALIARFGDSYHRPPDQPPLNDIRRRVYESRRRARRLRWAGISALAAAAAVLVAVGLYKPSAQLKQQRVSPPAWNTGATTPHTASADPRIVRATQALASAVRSAQLAVRDRPDDPFFREHLEAMRANAEHFRLVQERQLGGLL